MNPPRLDGPDLKGWLFWLVLIGQTIPGPIIISAAVGDGKSIPLLMAVAVGFLSTQLTREAMKRLIFKTLKGYVSETDKEAEGDKKENNDKTDNK